MPVYEYRCKDHGIFYELATISDSDKPCQCPNCAALAPRIIRIAPAILDMPKEKRHAYATNEKARHEPVFSTADRRNKDKEHSSGCGCSTPHKKSNLMYTAQGDKMFPSMRPWMISH